MITKTQIDHLRKKLGDDEMEKICGIGFRFNQCIGAPDCVRSGEHTEHTWWEQVYMGDIIDCKRTVGKNGSRLMTGQFKVPLRYWNFSIGYAKTKNLQDAVEWVKQKAIRTNGEAVDLRSLFGAESYSLIFKSLNIEVS